MTALDAGDPASAEPSAISNALSVRLSRARRRLIPAAVVAITGLLAVLGGVAPRALLDLTELSAPSTAARLLTGRALLLELGVLLLIIGRQLALGSRSAWTAAMLASAGVLLVELLRARLGLVTALATISVLALAVTRSAFRLRFQAGRNARRLLVPLGLFIALLAYALTA